MFRDIDISDFNSFKQYNNPNYFASELNFANVFAWKEYDHLQIYVNLDYIIIKGKDFFFPPISSTVVNFQKAIDFIKNYCDTHHFPFRIVGITKELIPFIKQENTKLYAHTALNEYIYQTESLATYRGKKYHAKRNFVNRFTKNYTYSFVSYTPSMRNQIIRLIDLWAKTKEILFEKQPIMTILDHLDILDCFCDCIIIDDTIQAFSISTIHNNTGLVLFEKANIAFEGIYPMLIQLVAKYRFANISYINRQEDMGRQELKKAKLSFNPIFLIEKHQLVQDDITQLRSIYNLSFSDSNSYVDYFFSKKEKTAILMKQNHIIKAVLYYRTQYIMIEGVACKAAFVFALATHPFYRNQGWMKKLFTKAFKEWYTLGYVFIVLHPDVEGFYHKFQFTPFGTIYTSAPTNCKKTNDIHSIHMIYDTFTQKYPIYTVRTLDDWHKIHQEIQANNGYFAITMTNNQPTGYLINDGDDTIEQLDLNGSLTTRKQNQIRIINLKAFLQIFPNQTPKDTSIIDPILKTNSFTPNHEIPLNIITIQDFLSAFLSHYDSISWEKY